MQFSDNFFKFVQNKCSGFGLLEVMLAVSITGGLALTIVKLMENTSQNTKQMEAKSEVIYLKGSISSILSNQTACNFTFSPLITGANLTTLKSGTSASVSVPNIKDKENGIAYSLASTNIAPLRISEIRLTNYNSTTGVANLIVDLNFRRSSTVVQSTKPISIAINFNIDESSPSSPVLIACSTMNVGGGEWLLTGNSGIDPAANYIGTSDNQPIKFRVNAVPAGGISSNGNAHLGQNSLLANTTGMDNIAFGSSALMANTVGRSNIALGRSSLRNSVSGNFVIAIGDFALNSAVGTGQTDNIAIGASALQSSTTGVGNTAIGSASQRHNTTGSHNTSLGKFSLASNTTGADNIGIGHSAVGGTTIGNNNIGIGNAAMGANISGNNNVAVGRMALQGNSTGTDNVAIGGWAGIRALTGSHNIFLGSGAGPGDHMIGSPIITGNNNIFIGHQSGLPSNAATTSNRFFLTNPSSSIPLMQGDFSTGEIRVATQFRVGAWAPHTFSGPGTGYIVLSDSSPPPSVTGPIGNNRFYARFSNGYAFYTNSNANLGVSLAANGDSWGSISDKNMKHDIQKINYQDHMDKIRKLPVYFWKYRDQSIPHMGPMAQDFYRIFKLGNGNDKVITTMDMDGVLIAGVKGLEEKSRKLQKKNFRLEMKIRSLEERIRKLEELIEK